MNTLSTQNKPINSQTHKALTLNVDQQTTDVFYFQYTVFV